MIVYAPNNMEITPLQQISFIQIYLISGRKNSSEYTIDNSKYKGAHLDSMKYCAKTMCKLCI